MKIVKRCSTHYPLFNKDCGQCHTRARWAEQDFRARHTNNITITQADTYTSIFPDRHNIIVTLTDDQIYTTIQALEWAQDFDNKGTSKHNAFIQRIINKLAKAKS